MPSIRLIPVDAALEAELQRDPAYLQAVENEDWPRLAAVLKSAFATGVLRDPPADAPPHWGGYVAIDTQSHNAVGSCAFKGPPNPQREAEIAYFTYPEFEGHGYATAMARALLDLATHTPHSQRLQRVTAHTLPEPSASTRVLEKAGMTHTGEVHDPDDGRVWRWEFPLPQ